MPSLLRQALALFMVGLRSIGERPGSSSVVILGVAGVVAVVLLILAISDGFSKTMSGSGRTDRAVILARGIEAESVSVVSTADVIQVLNSPGIQSDAGQALASTEIAISAPLISAIDGAEAFAGLRGITTAGLRVRTEVRLTRGRLFKSGLQELIVGEAAQRQFSGIGLGAKVPLAGGDWTVVGVFTAASGALESGLIADAETIRVAYAQSAFNSVLVQLQAPESLDELNRALSRNPRVNLEARREDQYLALLSAPLNRVLHWVAGTIGVLMAAGAIFAALNTMNFAVDSRAKEIATLRCIGFGNTAVMTAIVAECLMLAGLGAVLGVMAGEFFVDGRFVSTTGSVVGANPQMAYTLQLSSWNILLGVSLSFVIGAIGGIVPAIRIARTNLVTLLGRPR